MSGTLTHGGAQDVPDLILHTSLVPLRTLFQLFRNVVFQIAHNELCHGDPRPLMTSRYRLWALLSGHEPDPMHPSHPGRESHAVRPSSRYARIAA